jgi:hypothetical protein
MKNLFLGIAIFIFLTSIASAGWTGFEADQKISYFPGTTLDYLSRFPRIASGSDGLLYSVWAQGKTLVPYEIYFSKSTDNGRTWSNTDFDRMISADDGEGTLVSGERPVGLAVDSRGYAYAVWAESLTDVGYEIMFVKTTDGGATWVHSDADFAISFAGGTRANEPKIAVDHSDNLHVVWHQTSPDGTAEIYYGFSTDEGDNWTSQSADHILSFPDGFHALYPEIAVDGNNTVYVVWKEQETSDINSAAVYFGKKIAGQPNFTSETADFPISMAHRSTTTPSVAIGPDNAISVAYEARNEVGGSFKGAIYFTHSSDGGVTWSGLSGEVNVDLDPLDDTSSTDPSLVVTSEGNIAVSYCNFDLSSADKTETYISYSYDNGVTWTGNTSPDIACHWEMTGDDRPAYNPQLCLSSGDTLHVVWNEDCQDEGGSSGYYEIMYSRGDTLGTEGGGSGCSYVPGDINNNGAANGIDVTYGVSYFKGGNPPPYTCECTPGNFWFVAGDVNGNCVFNGIDITYMVAYFKGGASLIPCPSCPPMR